MVDLGMQNVPNYPGHDQGRELLIVCRHKAPNLAERLRDREVSYGLGRTLTWLVLVQLTR
jgi:hypothetical protein